MAHTRYTWSAGDLISSARLNNLEWQYDQALADIAAGALPGILVSGPGLLYQFRDPNGAPRRLFNTAATLPDMHLHLLSDIPQQGDGGKNEIYLGYESYIDVYHFFSRKGGTNEALAEISPSGTRFPKNVMFHAHASVDQSISTIAITKINLSVEDFDPNGVFDPTTSRFTAPVAGIYQVNAKVRVGNISVAGEWELSIRKNGSMLDKCGVYLSAGGVYKDLSYSDAIHLEANDYLELAIQAISSASGEVQGTTSTRMSAHLLSRS